MLLAVWFEVWRGREQRLSLEMFLVKFSAFRFLIFIEWIFEEITVHFPSRDDISDNLFLLS